MRDYYALADLRWQPVAAKNNTAPLFDQLQKQLLHSMQDDLNSPLALAALSAFSNTLQSTLVSADEVDELANTLKYIDDLLGLICMTPKTFPPNKKC